MRAVIITQPGGPEVLSVGEVETPTASGDQVLVRVEAAGLNRADLLQRAGHYPAPAGVRQDVPGLEYTGVVAEVGDAVKRWKPGDRVFGLIGGGGHAEYVLTTEDQIAAVPASLDPIQAAAVPEVFMTAWDALKQGGMSRGKRVLIHAAGSGVGTAAIQLVAAAGGTAYGTARTASKLEQARAYGLAMGVVQDDNAAWVKEVLAATHNQGMDIVLDFVGAPFLEPNLHVLAQRGRIVSIGTMGGAQGPIDLGLLMRKRASIIGTLLRSRPRDEKAALHAAFSAEVGPLLADGTVKPVVDRVFAARDAAAAHRYMESNANFGKIILDMRQL